MSDYAKSHHVQEAVLSETESLDLDVSVLEQPRKALLDQTLKEGRVAFDPPKVKSVVEKIEDKENYSALANELDPIIPLFPSKTHTASCA